MKINGDCPHCKEKVAIDIDKLEVKTPQELQNTSTTAQQTIQEVKPEPAAEPQIEIKTVAPSDEPYYECANGQCGEGMHKNPNYSKKPNKKCKNCDSLNGSKKCKNCGNKDEEEFDEVDDDELTELGIPEPEAHEHHHD